jgi:hypothetical protein
MTSVNEEMQRRWKQFPILRYICLEELRKITDTLSYNGWSLVRKPTAGPHK